MTVSNLRIFVSSPGDVAEERVIAMRLLDRLADHYSDVCQLEPIFWEHEPLLATETFQSQIIQPADTDIVVCILWSRLGTRLPPEITRPDGSRYQSGTEFEFENAADAHKSQGFPDLIVYRKTSEPVVSLKDEAVLLERLNQRKLLDTFIEKWFHGEEGTLVAAFHPFGDMSEFEDLLERHLRRLIDKRLEQSGVQLVEPAAKPARTKSWALGSPFRGLDVFEFEHAPIFFGRTRVTSDILDVLRRQAAKGPAFLLVLGMSGCGKSSLVRAGVLPLLVQPGVVEGVGLWRRAILRPSDSTGDLFDGLAAALLRDDALPELVADGTTAPQLAELLRDNPAGSYLLVKGALSQAASELRANESAPRQPEARLVLVVDQMEEMFSANNFSAAQRNDFLEAIAALAQSGRVWVIATMRSDFYPRCVELPRLVELKEGSGQYDLLPPTAAEIGHMIREPTLAAGLQFEQHPESGEPLDDVLRDAALLDRAGLPLLEFTLAELYNRRTPSNQLTHVAYEQLGGVDGALATRAEQVFQDLNPAVQNSLPTLFRMLVTVESNDTPTRRIVPLVRARADSDSAALVDSFVEARLLTTDKADDGTPVLSVAHEALLTQWQRLQDWLEQDRELLRIRSRVGTAATQWEEENRRGDLLLQTGKPLEEALQLNEVSGIALTSSQQDFVKASTRRAKVRERIKFAVVGLIALLGFLMTIAGGIAITQQREADHQRQRAEDNSESLRRTLYVSQVVLAEAKFRRGNVRHARELLKDCPHDLRDWEWNYLSRITDPSLVTLRGHQDQVICVDVTPDGKRIVSGSRDKTIRIWELKSDSSGSIVGEHQDWVTSLAVSPDGKRLVSGGKDKTLKLWDLSQQKLIQNMEGHQDEITAVAWSPSGHLLASASRDKTIKLWGFMSDDEPITLRGHKGSVNCIAFTSDGRQIVSGSDDKTILTWDVESGELETQNPMELDRSVRSVQFSNDGRYLLSALWGLGNEGTRFRGDGFVNIQDLQNTETGRSFLVHEDYLPATSFLSDGKRFATVSHDKSIKIWEWDRVKNDITKQAILAGHEAGINDVKVHGRLIVTAGVDHVIKVFDPTLNRDEATLGEHESFTTSVAFSPDGKRVVSGCYDKTVKVWDVSLRPNGKPVLDLIASSKVRSVAFTADGSCIVASGTGNEIDVWDGESGERLSSLVGHEKWVPSIVAIPGSNRLISASMDGSIVIWELPTQKS